MLRVVFHTNQQTSAPPTYDAGHTFHVMKGWWADSHTLPSWPSRQIRTPYDMHQTHKFQWLAEELPKVRHQGIVLLADTDTFVQCSPAELLERFAEMRSPLVVGAEARWWPAPDRHNNPWAGSTKLRYPNSGLAIGTPEAFVQLAHAQRTLQHFPCCPIFANYTSNVYSNYSSTLHSCMIDDQLCVQVALLRGVEYSLDTQARLFLNVGSTSPDELVQRHSDGRWVYVPSNTTPCVLHFNGHHSAKVRMNALAPLAKKVLGTWVVRPSVPVATIDAQGANESKEI